MNLSGPRTIFPPPKYQESVQSLSHLSLYFLEFLTTQANNANMVTGAAFCGHAPETKVALQRGKGRRRVLIQVSLASLLLFLGTELGAVMAESRGGGGPP